MSRRPRTSSKKSGRNLNDTAELVYRVFTVLMAVVFLLGVRSFFVIPPQAKEEAAEIEENLRRQQEENEKRLEEARAEAARRAEEEAAERQRIAEEEAAKYYYRDTFGDASNMNVVGIGDSVMLASVSQLYEVFPNGYFDAVFGRTIYDGMKVVNIYEEQGTLGDAVVFSLGANSYIEEEDIRELISHCGDRPTFWISTFGVSNDSNEKMRNVTAEYDNAFMVDWESAAGENINTYISADGLHPTAEGAMAYAQLIRSSINESLYMAEGDPS